MRQPAENGVHGYVIHDRCWHLLRKVLDSDDVPLERLVKICRSLPFPGMTISLFWGHDYGGLYEFDEDSGHPWYGLLKGPLHQSDVGKVALWDPVEVPGLTEMLQSTSTRLEEIVQNSSSNDCFGRIPWELREAIAICLPTTDAMSLRKASRAFLPLLSSQTFWASRFETGGERAFLFEKRKSPEVRDWFRLHQLTRSSQSPPGLRNRRRIWTVLEEVAQLLLLRPNMEVKLPFESPVFEQMSWRSVTGDLVRGANPSQFIRLRHGCRQFEKKRVLVPDDLTHVGIFKVGSAGQGYVCGLSLASASGEVICLGFTSEDQVIVKVSKITGFLLAMGPQGLKALKVIDDRGVGTGWVGSPRNTPVTERLATFNHVDAIEIGIDVRHPPLYAWIFA